MLINYQNARNLGSLPKNKTISMAATNITSAVKEDEPKPEHIRSQSVSFTSAFIGGMAVGIIILFLMAIIYWYISKRRERNLASTHNDVELGKLDAGGLRQFHLENKLGRVAPTAAHPRDRADRHRGFAGLFRSKAPQPKSSSRSKRLPPSPPHEDIILPAPVEFEDYETQVQAQAQIHHQTPVSARPTWYQHATGRPLTGKPLPPPPPSARVTSPLDIIPSYYPHPLPSPSPPATSYRPIPNPRFARQDQHLARMGPSPELSIGDGHGLSRGISRASVPLSYHNVHESVRPVSPVSAVSSWDGRSRGSRERERERERDVSPVVETRGWI